MIACRVPAVAALAKNALLSSIRARAMSAAAAAAVEAAPTTAEKVKGPNPRRHNLEKATKKPLLNVHDAVTSIQTNAWAKFDETMEISVNTGLDPRKPNQSVKGIARLPSGSGKPVRVCVIANLGDAKIALEAGADVVGAEDVIAAIQGGNVNFNTIIATPEMMPLLGKVGKILGPRGLMPNPKMGTVTKDVGKAVKTAKSGAVQFKTDKKGIIQGAVGKVSFQKDALLENVRSFMLALVDAKPDGFKGKYLKSVSFSSTMGPGVTVDLSSVDPSNPKFMLDLPVVPPKASKKK